ncbi:hypothetical protein CPS_3301 [Colwellia psychrerythraea 34H]|uniref:Uncharacterized protein n=1 Tax=Colwellia psychrerythraea (strain 34H / ATCC BAA-681) TaxID=167879 RepID=Q47YZ3_COLP3|nr:hypothetical protein CPS_3301 [Colwellia psychrerythraea 34H]
MLSLDESSELQPDKVSADRVSTATESNVVFADFFELKNKVLISMANFAINRVSYTLTVKSVSTMEQLRKKCANGKLT